MKWRLEKLENLVQIKGGKRLPKGEDFSFSTTNHPYIRARDIGSGKITIEAPVYISEETFRFIKNYIVRTNDVVITIVGANIGDIGFITQEFDGANLTENAVRIFPKDGNVLSSQFLKYSLLSDTQKSQLQQIASGAAQGKLGLYKIKEFQIPLPPLPTQQKIASILSAYDDLIENNLKRIRLLEEAAQHLYREWFVRFRFPGWEEVEVVDGLPVGWERKALGKICTEISSGGTPDRGNPLYWASPEIQWVKTKELRDDFVFESEEGISKEGLENSSAKLFPGGTILMAIYASPTLGRLGILTNEACFNQAMVGFNIDRNQISTEFLYYKLLEERVHLNNMAIGAAQQNINVKKVKEYEVILPSLDLINTFSRITSPFFSQRRALGGQNQKLKAARDILLPRLMNQTIEV